jgi:PPP family 3-phenylpropionic acid transporter
LIFVIATALIFIFHNIINAYTAQILKSVGGTASDLGLTLTLTALSEVPALVGFGFLSRRFKVRTLLIASAVFYVIRSFLFLAATSVWMIDLAMVIQGVSFAVYLPASVYYVDHLMNGSDKVKGQTFATSAMTLGGIFGSLIGGTLLDSSGVHVTLIFGSAAAVLGCLLMIYSLGEKKKPVGDSFSITE